MCHMLIAQVLEFLALAVRAACTRIPCTVHSCRYVDEWMQRSIWNTVAQLKLVWRTGIGHVWMEYCIYNETLIIPASRIRNGAWIAWNSGMACVGFIHKYRSRSLFIYFFIGDISWAYCFFDSLLISLSFVTSRFAELMDKYCIRCSASAPQSSYHIYCFE